jgi:hypothetical protein
LEIKLKRLAQVIAGCWTEAESSLAQIIAQAHPRPSEELITDLLAGELRMSVERASSNRKIERAFLEDLESEILDLSHADASRFAGLVASVNPHNKTHEGTVSAADFGLVVLRPQVQLTGWSNKTIECSRDHATGILAQAKLGHKKKRHKGYSWGRFKKTQEKLYPIRQSYYSLLLYRLKGEKLNDLDSVRWQLCHENTIEEAKNWLRADGFPKEKTSPELLKLLFDRQIGTDDPNIIKSVIAPTPEEPRVIEIRISWPDHSGPPPSFDLQQEHHQQEALQRICQ